MSADGNRFDGFRAFLEEHIDPDFGLLENLRIKEILNRREIADIQSERTFYKRNSLLLELIVEKRAYDGLYAALAETRQSHIVNYLKANGSMFINQSSVDNI